MLFTQNQRTRVVTNNESAERHVILSTTRAVSPTWCLSTLAILKWLEIIFCVIIIAVLQPYAYRWSAYGYVMFVAVTCMLITIITLIVYFLQLHNSTSRSIPWRVIEVAFNIFAVILFLFAFAVLIYDCVKLFGSYSSVAHHTVNNFDHNISSLKHRVAACTAFVGANCIFYLLSALYARAGYLL